MKKAFIIITSGESWWHKIALNYSQLSIDHAVSSRLDSDEFDYLVADRLTRKVCNSYDVIIAIPAGAIFLYGMYEAFFSNLPEI